MKAANGAGILAHISAVGTKVACTNRSHWQWSTYCTKSLQIKSIGFQTKRVRSQHGEAPPLPTPRPVSLFFSMWRSNLFSPSRPEKKMLIKFPQLFILVNIWTSLTTYKRWWVLWVPDWVFFETSNFKTHVWAPRKGSLLKKSRLCLLLLRTNNRLSLKKLL